MVVALSGKVLAAVTDTLNQVAAAWAATSNSNTPNSLLVANTVALPSPASGTESRVWVMPQWQGPRASQQHQADRTWQAKSGTRVAGKTVDPLTKLQHDRAVGSADE